MARYSMFWEGNSSLGGTGDCGPYSGDQFTEFVKAIFAEETGVLSGLQVTESSPAAKSIDVSAGKMVIYGHILVLDASLTLTIADNTSGNPRIDTIVAECDWAAQTITLKVVPGTPGASPTPPALTQNAGSLWQEPLAQVSVANGFSTITNTDIEDWRQIVIPGAYSGKIEPCVLPTAPAGWLLCAGQAVSRTRYAALFAAIGTTFGAGDGSTTFNLPDMRGRAFAGLDNMGGSSANVVTDTSADNLGGVMGAETHTLTESELPAHDHDEQAALSSGWSPTAVYHKTSDSGPTNNFNSLFLDSKTDTSVTVQPITTATTGGDAPHNNMPPTFFGNWIIKT